MRLLRNKIGYTAPVFHKRVVTKKGTLKPYLYFISVFSPGMHNKTFTM